jgi:protein-S-isoprenylcysteine O-methyltransferase Ste14
MIASAWPLVVIIIAVISLALTGNLFSLSPVVITLQVAAVALNVWARRSFASGTFRVSAAPAGESIIRRGPYRVIRHPMYAAALLFVWAGIASHASVFTLVVGGMVTGIAVARVRAEERLLRAKYPDYEAYARTTQALVPFVF